MKLGFKQDPAPGLCPGRSKQTSVAADFAIWRRAPPPALPWADVTLEFTSVSMPTSSTVAVSTVTLAMAWEQMRKQQLMSSTEEKTKALKNRNICSTQQLMSLKVVVPAGQK